jgi:formylglycine-generating enzyme required for sulfatase activity
MNAIRLAGATAALLCLLILAFGSLGQEIKPIPKQFPEGRFKLKLPSYVTNSVGMKLVQIPKGKFVMGSPPGEVGRDPKDEGPQHEVTLSWHFTKDFLMGAYEVTQGQYQKVMGKNPSGNFNQPKGTHPDLPVEQVNWDDAAAFCKTLSALPEEVKAGRHYRLPSEAEWEYACRAGTQTRFAFGNSLASTQANFGAGLSKGHTTKVGSYSPNAWGLYDMHGNVWEWCADWYDPDYYKNSPKENPHGPNSSPKGQRIVRGGDFHIFDSSCRSAFRGPMSPATRAGNYGFRVACDAELNIFMVPGKQLRDLKLKK